MFDLDSLLVHIAHPTRKPASPRETPSSTASEYAGTQPATYPQAPATYPQASAPPTPSRVDLRVMRVDAGNLPASGSNVQDEENPDLAGLRVGSGMCAVQPTRDPDPSGCPTHWHHVPELPPRGTRVRMTDRDGYGCLYRFKHAGVWYLLKFLPPFDGTLSIRDSKGQPFVFPSLEALSRYLGALEDGL